MSAVTDNAEWKMQNEKFRSPNARRPDVHYIGSGKKGGSNYVILADGWEAPKKRRQKWIAVPPDKSTSKEIDDFGSAEAKRIAESRGISPTNGDVKVQKKSASASTAKGETPLCVALDEIEADVRAGVNPNTGGNTTAGCRQFRDLLPPERLQVPVKRITPKELERHIRQTIVDHPTHSLTTKHQYLAQSRSVARALRDNYDLDENCEGALRAPPNMTGADTPDRPFSECDIGKMESEVASDRFVQELGHWAEAIEGAYYFGSRLLFQPVDVFFRKWDELSPDLKLIRGRRHKTGEWFSLHVPDCLRRKWLIKRRARGGIYATGYIFPEFVYGIRKCQKARGPLDVFSHTKEENIETNIINRFGPLFNVFLRDICGIKRPGISFVSFRHHHLPVLKAQGTPIEVAMDMAGHKTALASFEYGGSASEQQLRSASALLERHIRNCKAGKHDTVIVTALDCAHYVVKALRKGMKKLLTAIGSSSLEVLRKINEVGVSQARSFEATAATLCDLNAHVRALNDKQDATNAELSALRAEVYEIRGMTTRSITHVGEETVSRAFAQDRVRLQFPVRPEEQNLNSKETQIDSYII